MGSLIFSGIIVYIILIGSLWFSTSLNGTLGTIVFWLLFLLSTFVLIRLYSFIRDFFITIFAKCHEVDQDYIDAEMKKYEESKT